MGKTTNINLVEEVKSLLAIESITGIEGIQYGPGDSSLCHTDNEQLSISDPESCSEVYLELIRLICD